MARTKKYSIKNVEKALIASGGFKSEAARKLGCSTRTIYNYINKDEKLKDLIWDIEEQYLDLAEANIIKRLRDGDFEASKFYLERKGRSRGYDKNGTFNKDKTMPTPLPPPLNDDEINFEQIQRQIDKGEILGVRQELIDEAKALLIELQQGEKMIEGKGADEIRIKR